MPGMPYPLPAFTSVISIGVSGYDWANSLSLYTRKLQFAATSYTHEEMIA
jgi:hypothetical protein